MKFLAGNWGFAQVMFFQFSMAIMIFYEMLKVVVNIDTDYCLKTIILADKSGGPYWGIGWNNSQNFGIHLLILINYL